MATVEEHSLLAKLDSVAPLAKFDAFPKLPSTYKARSESRGFMTLFVAILAVLLVLNDVGEYIWGWSDYEFSVDNNKTPFLNINLDMVVAMPCGCEWVSLRFYPFSLCVCLKLCWGEIGDTSLGECRYMGTFRNDSGENCEIIHSLWATTVVGGPYSQHTGCIYAYSPA